MKIDRTGWVVAAVFGLALGPACTRKPPPVLGAGDAASDATTLPPDGGADAGSDAGQPCTLTSPPANAACAACLQSSCCTGANMCLGSAACNDFVACIRACPPAPDAGNGDAGIGEAGTNEQNPFVCQNDCRTKFPAGSNPGIVLIDCEDNACAGKCN